MNRLKHKWQRAPHRLRQTTVLLLGGLFIIAAGLTGWIPGPGGTPLFLIGIAILATEFVWAERLRDYVLYLIKNFSSYLHQHRIIAVIFWIAVATWASFSIWFIFFR